MPELEEGNLWLRGIGPLNMTLEHQVAIARQARAIMASYPEVESIVTQSGRPDDGTDTEGFYSSEYFVPLRPQKDWPKLMPQTGWRRWLCGATRARTKREIVDAMNAELECAIPGIMWNFSQNIRDNVMEALSGVKGDNSLKIFGPDLDKLEVLAAKAKNILQDIQGIDNVGIFHIRGTSHLEFRVDPEKCQKWGVTTADVNNVVSSAVGARAMSSMVEGEKLFDISIRWPKWRRTARRRSWTSRWTSSTTRWSWLRARASRPRQRACLAPPAVSGSLADTSNPISSTPRLRLGDLVTPVGADCAPDPSGQFERPGASDIYRENGKRMIAIKFSVRGRDLGSAVDEARRGRRSSSSPLPGRLERRVRADGGRQRPAHVDHPLVAGLDLRAPVLGFPLVPGHDRGLQQRLRPGDRRHLGVVPDGDEFQHLRGGRLRVAVRRGHHGRPAVDLVFQRPPRPGLPLTKRSCKGRRKRVGR